MPYVEDVGDVVPPQNMLNMRVDASRRRLAKRPGLAKRFTTQLGGANAVQALGVVTKAATITGYTMGTCTPISTDWSSQTSSTLAGQAWFLKNNISMYAEYNETTAGSSPVTCCCMSPDGTKVAIGSSYVSGGFTIVRISLLNVSDASVAWSITLSTAATNRTVNSVEVSANHVFVCSNQFLHVLDITNGSLLYTSSVGTPGWAQELIQCRVSTDGRYLFAAFKGTSIAATLPSGQAVTAGKYASHFRSGIAKYRIDVGQPTPIVRLTYGAQPPTNYYFYESAKGHLRFSEAFLYNILGSWPTVNVTTLQGCFPTALDVCPDGGVVVTHTNQGWGPTAAYHPDGSSPYYSVTKFDSAGLIVWRTDTNSIREVGDGGYINDIPTGVGDAPSLQAVTVGPDGTVYVAGRRTIGSQVDVFALDGDSGVLLWDQDLGTTASPYGIAFGANDNSVWVAGQRSDTWVGSGGAFAHLWKLNSDDGSILFGYDLNTASKTAYGVDVRASDGVITYTTDKVP